MKEYVVVHPSSYSHDDLESLRNKAKLFYGEVDYKPASMVLDDSDSETFFNIIKKASGESCIIELLILGMTTVILSHASSVYFSKDWKEDDTCKLIHMLAFKYGLDMRYESV